MNFRKNVAAVITDKNGLVLAGERTDIPGSWQLPQGGVEKGENEKEALFREIKEETGLDREYLKILAVSEIISYEFPHEIKKKMKFDGQAQTYFLLKISDVGWNLSSSDEFNSFEWFEKEEILKIVVEFKRKSYIEAFRQLFGEKQ